MGVTESQREIQLEPERASKSLREPVRARVGVTESQRDTGRDPVLRARESR